MPISESNQGHLTSETMLVTGHGMLPTECPTQPGLGVAWLEPPSGGAHTAQWYGRHRPHLQGATIPLHRGETEAREVQEQDKAASPTSKTSLSVTMCLLGARRARQGDSYRFTGQGHRGTPGAMDQPHHMAFQS